MMLHQAFLSLVFISFHISSPQVGSQVGKGCAFGECYCVTLRGQEKLLCIAMTYKSVLDFIWEIKGSSWTLFCVTPFFNSCCFTFDSLIACPYVP